MFNLSAMWRIRMYRLATAFFACIFSLLFVQQVTAQYRIKETINSNWQFYKGDNPPEDHSNWQKISLPHTYNTIDVNDDDPGYYRGNAWYSKKVFVPASWKDKDVYLHFEGASQVATVYINGKQIAEHIGGYSAFNCKINSYISFTDTLTAFQVLVKVNNSHNENIPPLSADFTFYGGIYRDVFIEAINLIHFDADNYASSGIFITTPSVTAASANIRIKGAISNNTLLKRKLIISNTLSDASGKIVQQSSDPVAVNENKNTDFSIELKPIQKPHLWSPEDPYLYKLSSVIQDAATNEILDEVVHPVGFRWFSFTADKGFFLNGKSYKLWGASRHQDNPNIGNALSDALHIKDIKLLKEMGANFIRIAHYPQDPAVLEACDRLGLLAAIETPIVNAITETDAFTKNCLDMQVEMIRQHFNHPSIILWAYMNEILLRMRYNDDKPRQEIYLKNVVKLARSLDSITIAEDATRYTMSSFHGDINLYSRTGLAEIPQVIGWNQYSGWYSPDIKQFAANMDRHRSLHPTKPVIVSEYGADGDPRVRGFLPERFDKTLEYETFFHKEYVKAIQARPFISGAALWNLADFNAEVRAESMPHINNKGLLTIDRKPKDVYYFYQSQLLKDPFVKIGSANWRLRSGIENAKGAKICTQTVQVFTNQSKVSLVINGKPLNEQHVTDGIAEFKVPFVDGHNLIEAIIEANGKISKDETEVNFLLQPFDLKDSILSFKEINISLGDKRYVTDENMQQVWLPEKVYEKGGWGYIGGELYTMKDSRRQPYGSDKNILQTDLDPVYETQRVDIKEFKLDVPDGSYEITLHFAELLSCAIRDANIYNLDNGKFVQPEIPEPRQFNVVINKKKVIENLGNDNYLETETAYSTKLIVYVKNGEGITIQFDPIKEKPILNGLQVRKIF